MRFPRVGVAATVLRPAVATGSARPAWEVLLVQRGKEPNKGRWCLPGGSVEFGEPHAAAAAREMREEVPDARMSWAPGPAFFVTDALAHNASGEVQHHYLLVHCLALAPHGANSEERAASDAARARWVSVDGLGEFGDQLLPQVPEVLSHALERVRAMPQGQESGHA